MTGLAAVVATSASAASAPPPEGEAGVPAAATAQEFSFTGDRVSLPIVMVREFPFVVATVAGMQGKLLLDPGCEAARIVNDHWISLAGGMAAGSGRFGNGQTLTRRLHAAVPDIRVGAFRFSMVRQVKGIDARLLEQITPDAEPTIIALGYGFLRSCTSVWDYPRGRPYLASVGHASVSTPHARTRRR